MSQNEVTAGNRTERKKEETRQKVIGVALQLFRQNGLEATTMEQIAEVADIAKGTLYNYFPAKEAIIHEYIDRVSREKNAARVERLHELPDTRTRMVDSVKRADGSRPGSERIFREVSRLPGEEHHHLAPRCNPSERISAFWLRRSSGWGRKRARFAGICRSTFW